MANGSRLKIVIFGAFGAGKTTLIRTLDPESTHIEANCAGGTTTVALDFGRVLEDGLHIHIYGTPGQERFGFAREIIAKGMDGAVLLVDVTSPLDDFTRHLYDTLSAAQVPSVVFLNKCGCEGAHPEAFAACFGTTPVRAVSARDRKACLDALSRFAGTLATG
ncbi:MAG: GTP-binding protein [Methanoregula sp.]|uniref:GTP-binding protein n=1 Tax=Methanoregula sp. TaxID=2052170 RepID=UPI003D112D13